MPIFTRMTLATLLLMLGPRPALSCSCASMDFDASLDQVDAVFDGYVTQISQANVWIASNEECPAKLPVRTVFEHQSQGAYHSVLCEADHLVVEFEVFRSWKGIDDPKVSVQTSAFPTACGYHFDVGGSYRVFAVKKIPGNDLETNRCLPTAPSGAPDQLRLGEPDRDFLVERSSQNEVPPS